MWLIDVWQLAQMTADVLWKSMGAVGPPVMLSNAKPSWNTSRKSSDSRRGSD